MLWNHKVEGLSLSLIIIVMIIKTFIKDTPRQVDPGTQIKYPSISKETKSLFPPVGFCPFLLCLFVRFIGLFVHIERGGRRWAFPFPPPLYIFLFLKSVSVRCLKRKYAFCRSFKTWLLAGYADTSVNPTLEVKDFYCGF